MERLPANYLNAMAVNLRILGHPDRLRILECLDLEGELSATMLIQRLSLTQSAASQHLAKLCSAGILSCRRQETRCFYRISGTHALTILNCMRTKLQEQIQ